MIKHHEATRGDGSKSHSLFTKVGFLKPIQTTDTLLLGLIFGEKFGLRHFKVCRFQRQNAEYLWDMKPPSAHCVFAVGCCGPMKDAIVGSGWQTASHHFSIRRVWSLTLARSNTLTFWWIRTLLSPLLKNISLLYAHCMQACRAHSLVSWTTGSL